MSSANPKVQNELAGLREGDELLPAGAGAASMDWARIRAHLAARGLQLDPDFAPRRFKGGLANINMLIKLDGDFAVLRRPPDGPLPKGAHDMAREHRVLSKLAPVFPLAPRSLYYCDDVAVAGAPFQILEYRSGRSVRGDTLGPLPETLDMGAALSELLVNTLAQIHAVDTLATGLGDLGRPEGFLSRTIAGWSARANDILDGRLCAACRDVKRWMEAYPTPSGAGAGPVLVHNDFKLDNMLLKPDQIAVEAVLDWDMATRGDAFLDLASLLSYWTEAGDPPFMHALAQMPTAKPGFLSREAAAQTYAKISGRSLDGFIIWRVLAVFRAGVVFHQLRALPARDAEMTARLARFDPDEFFAFALDITQGKIF